MHVTHDDVLAMFGDLIELTVLDEANRQAFRVRAYEKARQVVQELSDVTVLSDAQLDALDGIGQSTARKIREFLKTGQVDQLENLRKKYPAPFVQLCRVPGVGPKTAHRLRDQLGVASVSDLRQALGERRIRTLRGFGIKKEIQLKETIAALGESAAPDRTPINRVLPAAQRLAQALRRLPPVSDVAVAGSLRRMRETIGNVDLLVASEHPGRVLDAVEALADIRSVSMRGPTHSKVRTAAGLQIDVRVVPREVFGAALRHLTGSKAHNLALQQRARARGWTLNEYGLFDSDNRALARDESRIYGRLDLAWIPPPMREDIGEIELAERGELPTPPTVSDINGDLHVHTNISGDGRSPIEEVVAHAAHRGYRYLAVTDHAEMLPRIGVGREVMLEQREQLKRLQPVVPDLRLLHGVELNIGPDGGLDYDAEFRAGFQWRLAGIHSHFNLDREAQTRRVLRAIEDPTVDAIAHLSGRMIGRRPPIQLDIPAVLQAAARTGTAIEINVALPRLDAAAEVLRQARDMGVTMVLSTDSHHVSEFDRVIAGVEYAARGWIDKSMIANTWPQERFLGWLASPRESAD